MKRAYISIIILCSLCLLVSGCKSDETKSSIFEEIRTAPVLHDRVVDAVDMPAAVKEILNIK